MEVSHSIGWGEENHNLFVLLHSHNDMVDIYCTTTIVFCVINIPVKIFIIYFLYLWKQDRDNSIGITLSLHLCYAEFWISIASLIASVLTLFFDQLIVTMLLHLSITVLFLPGLYCGKLLIMATTSLKVSTPSLTSCGPSRRPRYSSV